MEIAEQDRGVHAHDIAAPNLPVEDALGRKPADIDPQQLAQRALQALDLHHAGQRRQEAFEQRDVLGRKAARPVRGERRGIDLSAREEEGKDHVVGDARILQIGSDAECRGRGIFRTQLEALPLLVRHANRAALVHRIDLRPEAEVLLDRRLTTTPDARHADALGMHDADVGRHAGERQAGGDEARAQALDHQPEMLEEAGVLDQPIANAGGDFGSCR